MAETSHAACQAALEKSHAETRAAFENRAVMYAYIFDELEAELGTERARELMKRAIFRRGVEIGQQYREAAGAGDLKAVGEIFCDTSPCEGSLFEPSVAELADGRTVLCMTGCPLKDAWEKLGLPPERVDLLCEIAAEVDEGTFAGAGLDLDFIDRAARPGADRCLLEITLKHEAPAAEADR